MAAIERVKALDNYRLYIELSNENIIIIDLKKKLNTLRFSRLSNYDVFESVRTDGYSLIFDKGRIIISFAEIMDILQSNRNLYLAM
jgi:hypothetical protein